MCYSVSQRVAVHACDTMVKCKDGMVRLDSERVECCSALPCVLCVVVCRSLNECGGGWRWNDTVLNFESIE